MLKEIKPILKVGLLFAGDFEEGNGGTSRVKAHAKGIRECGEDVSLIILHAASPERIEHKKYKGYWEGIYYEFLNRSNSRPQKTLTKVFDSLKSLVNSTAFLFKNGRNFDVFYLYSPKPFQVFHVYLILKILKIPLVVEMAERYSAFYDQSGIGLGKILHKYAHFVQERLMNHLSDHLVVISWQLLNYYKQYVSSEKLSLIPISVDVKRFSHLPSNGFKPFRIGYLGSFGSKDGVSGILKAFEAVSSDIPNLKLKMMGPASGQFKELVSEKKLQYSDIEYTGPVKYDEIPEQLRDCDLLIVNRPNTPYANYGFPTKLGEYLSSGQPVIATKVGDIEYYLSLEEDVILVNPDNKQELENAIKKRYQNYEWYKQLGFKGAESCCKHFDHHKNSNDLCRIFYQVTCKPIPSDYKGYNLKKLREKDFKKSEKETAFK